MAEYRILTAGDTAIVVEFGDSIDRGLKAIVLALARRLDEPRLPEFFSSEYTVQSGSDRVGMRLQGGAAIQHAKGFNVASDATAPGSIQVPGNGQEATLNRHPWRRRKQATR